MRSASHPPVNFEPIAASAPNTIKVTAILRSHKRSGSKLASKSASIATRINATVK